MTSDLDLDYVEFETRLTDEVARDWEEFGRGGLRMRGDGVEHVYEIVDDAGLETEDDVQVAQADVSIDHRHLGSLQGQRHP